MDVSCFYQLYHHHGRHDLSIFYSFLNDEPRKKTKIRWGQGDRVPFWILFKLEEKINFFANLFLISFPSRDFLRFLMHYCFEFFWKTKFIFFNKKFHVIYFKNNNQNILKIRDNNINNTANFILFIFFCSQKENF